VLSCCRFDGRFWVFHEAGRGLCREVDSVESSRSRQTSWSENAGYAAHAARDLDVHENVLRKWVKEFGSDPVQAFPGQGQMKPE
jgi:hypothetical protein